MSTSIYYNIDNNGAIIGQFDSTPPADLELTIVHTTPPPDTMLTPRWVANAWMDTATRTEHEARIDQDTSAAIQQWCRSKGKNEQYYVNRGIRVAISGTTDTTNIEYRQYQEYRAFVDAQIKIGKAKKNALP